MDELALNDLRHALDGLLSISAKIEKIEFPEQRGCYYNELTIDLKVDGKVVSSETLSLPGYEED